MLSKKILKKIGIASGLLFLLLSIGLVSFTAFVDKRSLIENQLSGWTGRKISLSGPFSVSIGLEPVIKVEQFALSNAPWSSNPEMISAGSIEVVTSLKSLFSGNLEIKSVTLNEPKVLLERSKDGKANWIFNDTVVSTNPEVPTEYDPNAHPLGGISSLNIKEGALTYINEGQQADFNLVLKSFQASHRKEDNTINLKSEGTLLDGMRLFARLSGTTRKESKADPGYFQVEAIYSTKENSYSLNNLGGMLGADPISGDLHVSTGNDGKLSLSGNANLSFLDVQGFFEGTGLPATDPAKQLKVKPSKYLFSDNELSLGVLSAVNADMKLNIKTLPLHKMMTVNEIESHISLKDGVLKVSDSKGIFANGQFSINYELDTNPNPARYNLKITANDISYGDWLSEKKLAHGIKGKGKAALEVSGEGNALRSMASSASGQFNFISENGMIKSKDLEIVALSLDDAIPSLFKNKSESMPIHCLMTNYSINKGIAVAKDAIMHTGVITVLGAGNVNLKNEQFLMSVHTRTNSASVSSFLPPVEVSGNWFKPKVEWDASGSAAEMFDSLGSLIASPVTLASRAFGDDKAKAKSPCQQALIDNASDIKSIRSNKKFLRNAANSIGDAGESISDGVGDVLGGIGKGIGSLF